MDKTLKRYLKAYGFMFAVDLLFPACLWLVWYEVDQVNLAIDNNADTIKFYSGVFTMLISFMVPVLHVIFTIDFLRPEIIDKNMIKGFNANWFLILFLGALFVLSIFVKVGFIHHIEDSGYTYCPEKSYRTTSSKVLVFTMQKSACISN